MPYDPKTPPALLANGIGGAVGLRHYGYRSTTDSVATVLGAGYISNARKLGMRVGDALRFIDPEMNSHHLQISGIDESGAATLEFPGVAIEAIDEADLEAALGAYLVGYQDGEQVRFPAEQVGDVLTPVATQAEAEAGELNEKRMTPLRTRQAIDTYRTPASLGAPLDDATGSSADFVSLLAEPYGIINVGVTTPAGSGGPAYVVDETVFVPHTRSIRGERYLSRIRAADDGGELEDGTMFRLNVNTSHDWVQSLPGTLSSKIEDMVIRADVARDNGHLIDGFEFAGSCHFRDIWFIGLSQGIKQPLLYSDLVTVERIQSYEQAYSATPNYMVDLDGTGDGVKVAQVLVTETKDPANPSRTEPGYSTHMRFKSGAIVENMVNGHIHIEDSLSIKMDSFHMETGTITLDNASADFGNASLYMRGKTGLDNVPLVITQTTGSTSVESNLLHIHDVQFIYINIAGGFGNYSKTNHNFEIDAGGAPPRALIQFERIGRRDQSDADYANGQVYGASCGQAAFDDYSHLASVKSLFANGQWLIDGKLDALPSTTGIAAISLASHRAWEAASGTYYYKLVLLLDKKRRIGRVGSAEVSIAVTNGGNGPSLVLETPARRNAILRLYRGTSSGSYDNYVDVPLVAGSRLHDSGSDVCGYTWISRTAGPVDTINTDIDAGLILSPGDTAATSDAYGRVVAYARTYTAPPTQGAWRKGDEVRLITPRQETLGVFHGWVRLTDCTEASAAHVMGTDWAQIVTLRNRDWLDTDNTGGVSLQRPNGAQTYLWIDNNNRIHFAGSKPADASARATNGLVLQKVDTCTTATRPTAPSVGESIFDTSINKPIWCSATGPVVWRDASGTVV